ncbi:Rho termination factor N-terminal domain-containing protein [Acinetobacter portensis]|uniref:Rho termination factor N-terminal domain-containing protein n=1 Tax=Acinetobacter portensis TaxID=1839785 RepID=UPI0013D0A2A2|nr:Rho termination factor N-terminal domain-containing protein [Acinetobacter portensis]
MVKKITVVIALTSAVAIDGEIRVAGDEVEVDQDLAKDLLTRGRGVLVEASDTTQAADDEIDLSKMTKAQLVEFALHEYEIELDASLNKDALIEAIQTAAADE